MKSLLVANSVYTTAGTTPDKLNKGVLAIIDYATNKTVKNLSGITTGMYKFVVGLGDGKWIDGVWLNAANDVKSAEVAPSAGVAKTVTIDDFKLIPLCEGQDAELHITVDAKNSFTGNEKTLYVACAAVNSTSQTIEDIKDALYLEATKLAKKLTNLYGKTFTLGKTTGDNGAIWTLTCADASIDFNVSLGGCLKATTTVNTSRTLPTGRGVDIAQMEKDFAIATAGYNPNFDDASKAYGDIFVADKASTYYTAVVTATAPHTDTMPLHEQGATVVQYLACKASMSTLLA